MIELNGAKFAKNNREFTESLFFRGGTCKGYYKVRKTGIDILDHQKNKIGVITKHKVLASATKQPNGKFWYSYADIDVIGRYDSYMQQREEIDNILSEHGII